MDTPNHSYKKGAIDTLTVSGPGIDVFRILQPLLADSHGRLTPMLWTRPKQLPKSRNGENEGTVLVKRGASPIPPPKKKDECCR